jgi:DNA-binding PadR family transcriptional regulator
MARASQTELAVLGALSVEPMTGYGLRAAITDTLGQFWHESFGQIYPTLTALEATGLVERDESTAGSTTRRITAAGEARLRELLAEPFTPPKARDPLLLRLFFGRHVDPDLTRERLEQALEAAQSRSQEFERVRAEIQEQPEAPDALYWLITLSAGEHAARARIAWAREALDLLDRGAAGPRVTRGAWRVSTPPRGEARPIEPRAPRPCAGQGLGRCGSCGRRELAGAPQEQYR